MQTQYSDLGWILSCPLCKDEHCDGIFEIGGGFWGICLTHQVKWHAFANSISMGDIRMYSKEWEKSRRQIQGLRTVGKVIFGCAWDQSRHKKD